VGECKRLSARIKRFVFETGRWSKCHSLYPRRYFDLPRNFCGKAESWSCAGQGEKKMPFQSGCDQMIGPEAGHAPLKARARSLFLALQNIKFGSRKMINCSQNVRK